MNMCFLSQNAYDIDLTQDCTLIWALVSGFCASL